ncbi:MFS transporter, partial [Actinospica sp. MGRD01-02]
MALIGVPLLAVLYLHATTFEVGALAAAGYLPWLLIGLAAGAWVDRLRPRPLMIACDVASAALYASVPAAYAFGVLGIGQLLVVQLLAGAAAVVFSTAYQVNLPSLVTADELAEGNAKLQASSSAAALGGRGLAGVAAQGVGATASLAFNAVSFLVSAFCLMAIGSPESRPPEAESRSPETESRPPEAELPPPKGPRVRRSSTLRRDVADGMAFVFGDPYLRPLTIFVGLANFALDGLAALVVVFLVRVVGASAAVTGLLAALPGLGGLLGASVARPVVARVGSARGLLLATVGALPFALLIPLAGHGAGLALYVVGTLIAASGVTVGSIILATFRQSYCLPGMLGRVTGTMRFLTFGVGPFGALFGGALGTWLGARDALWIVLGVLALAGTPLLGRTFVPRRDLPGAPRDGRLDAGDQSVWQGDETDERGPAKSGMGRGSSTGA